MRRFEKAAGDRVVDVWEVLLEPALDLRARLGFQGVELLEVRRVTKSAHPSAAVQPGRLERSRPTAEALAYGG